MTPNKAKNNMLPPAISKSKGPGVSFVPLSKANKLLEAILKTPSPNAKEGISLNIQDMAFPASLVDGMILKINIANGPILPIKKWKKNVAT